MADATPHIAAIVGSLRARSHHRRLLGLTRELVGDRATVSEAPLRGVPFFDQDLEDAGATPAVEELREVVGGADGLLVLTPEYNRSVPAVVKNAVDWLSRPFLAGALMDMPVGIVAATPGRHDAAGVREHLAVSAASAGAAVHHPSLALRSITRRFAPDEPVDDELVDEYRGWLEGFLGFVDGSR